MIDNDAFKLLLNNLFLLILDDIANILCTTFNKMMVLIVTLADKHQACPYCGFTAPKIKEYVTKEVTHSALTTQKCIIKYRARRYKCPVCGKTFYEFNPFVFKSQKISILTVHNILKDLPSNPKKVNMSAFFLILKSRFPLMFYRTVKRNIF